MIDTLEQRLHPTDEPSLGTLFVDTERMEAADAWEPKLRAELRSADIFLFFVSTYSAQSNGFMWQEEFRIARERWEDGAVWLIPVVHARVASPFGLFDSTKHLLDTNSAPFPLETCTKLGEDVWTERVVGQVIHACDQWVRQQPNAAVDDRRYRLECRAELDRAYRTLFGSDDTFPLGTVTREAAENALRLVAAALQVNGPSARLTLSNSIAFLARFAARLHDFREQWSAITAVQGRLLNLLQAADYLPEERLQADLSRALTPQSTVPSHLLGDSVPRAQASLARLGAVAGEVRDLAAAQDNFLVHVAADAVSSHAAVTDALLAEPRIEPLAIGTEIAALNRRQRDLRNEKEKGSTLATEVQSSLDALTDAVAAAVPSLQSVVQRGSSAVSSNRTRGGRRSSPVPLADVRDAFLGFYAGRGHTIVTAASLVPKDDPTLLFTNAGMVPFKNYFTGAAKPPYLRAASSQKCMRAGGKHNDLDHVGYTSRHHTFFEMLGGFSFGDYFKDVAIENAWSLLTKELALSPDKLLVTVYDDDNEAASIWKKVAGLSDEKIIRIATSDNFWSMGDTGPCGPCSEVFYDRGPSFAGGPPGGAAQDGDRFIEIWNLVFLQFEQFYDGRREPLPKPSIDSGMGLERIAAVLQGVHSTFEIDLFKNLIAASEDLTGVKADGERAFSHRVIADHLRAVSFLIADGVRTANEGRGYVLRRIMRRAMRHAHSISAEEPLLHRLVSALVAEMGQAYPELEREQATIEDQLLEEEERFRRTLRGGLKLIEEEMASVGSAGKINGKTAFKLYDTFGFPLDLTQDIARSHGLEVDIEGFDAEMDEHRGFRRDRSPIEVVDPVVWQTIMERTRGDVYCGDGNGIESASLAAIVMHGEERHSLGQGETGLLVFDRTPFYGESGGQAGDRGVVAFANGAEFEVEDTQKVASGVHVHLGRLRAGRVDVGDAATLTIDRARRQSICANQSASHLLHSALRNVLGPQVVQKGLFVEADYFRFDFNHHAAMTGEEIGRVEAEVNAVIHQNAEVITREMKLEDAINEGASALFGERYGERVRVVSLGRSLDGSTSPYSMTLCAGTHVNRTGDMMIFTILSEAGVAAGVRRIEGATGLAALAHLKAQADIARKVAVSLKAPVSELPARVVQMQDERRQLAREANKPKE